MDFLKFIIQAITEGYLEEGSILVYDNASVHASNDTLYLLYPLLDAMKIKLRFLPAYSPELNPIELVFMKVKRYLREKRTPNISLWTDIRFAFAYIQWIDVFNFYSKCYKRDS